MAARKAGGLLRCGALVTVIAPAFCDAMTQLTPLTLERRPYAPGDAAGYRLVVTATGIPAVDGAVYADAEAAGVWVNSADDVAHCSFILPSVHRDGPVSVAVSTGRDQPRAGRLAARPAGRERRARIGRAGRTAGPGASATARRRAEHRAGGLGRPARRPASRAGPGRAPRAGPRARRGGHRSEPHPVTGRHGCATMSAVPATSRTRTTVAAHTMAVASRLHRLLRRHAASAHRGQRDLEPALRRPQHALGQQGDPHEDGEPAHDPPVAERVGPVAESEEEKAEDGDAVDGAAGPVHPRTEVPLDRLGEGRGGPEQRAEAPRRERARHRGGQSDHHATDVEDEDDVEGRPVRLVVHARHLHPWSGDKGVRHAMMQQVRAPEPVP